MSPNSLATLGYAPERDAGNPALRAAPPRRRRAARGRRSSTGSPRPSRAHGGTLFRIRHRDGSWRWFEGGGVNYRTARGETRVVAVVRDVTEQRRAEDERRTAGGLDPPGPEAREPGPDGGRHRARLQQPADADPGRREPRADGPAARFCRSARGSRGSRRRRSARPRSRTSCWTTPAAARCSTETLDLSRLVGELGELLETTVARKAELHHRLPPDLPPIEADAAQLSQVVMNLITNAAEAIGAGRGRIDVAHRQRVGDARRARRDAARRGVCPRGSTSTSR